MTVASDRPVAVVAVRLCDLAPGGASTRVTYGVLNLTHRDSHAAPQPLKLGEFYVPQPRRLAAPPAEQNEESFVVTDAVAAE